MGVQAVSLVDYIRCHEGISSAELAQHFGVSTRTMRDYIRHANEALFDFARIAFHRDCMGYRCDVQDEKEFELWTVRAKSLSVSDPAVSTASRSAYLLNNLLVRNSWITLDDLASVLFVSRASISGDLKQLEPLLEKYNLVLERRPHYGIRVKGTEMSRRLCLAEGVARSLAADEQEANTFEEELAPLLDTVSATVDRVLEDHSFSISSVSYQNLLVHLGIALVRMKDGNYVPASEGLSHSVAGTHELTVADAIANALGDEMGFNLPESEIAYIAIHLAGKRVFSADQKTWNRNGAVLCGDDESGNIVISDEVWDTVSQMLDVIWQGFRLDFRNDMELRWNLALHIMPLSTRLQYGLRMDNPLLKDIKMRYPLAYAVAMDAASVLTIRYGVQPSEDETGYLALGFALAMERRKTEYPKRNVLVVCASGAGSARLLLYRMRKEFGEQLGFIATCEVAELYRYDLSNIDYIVTTIPLPIHLDVPVRQVTLFLDEHDRRDIHRLLEGSESSLEGYFSQELFFTHQRFSTKVEALSFLCMHATAYDNLPPDLEQLVWEREHAAPTAFGNGVALPHPIKAVANHSFVAISLLDTPP